MMSDVVKVIFDLERDPEEPSFPPVSAETLNATPAASGKGLIIDNTPFFIADIALGDLVEATPVPGTPNKYRFSKVLEQSTAKSLSIIFLTPEIKNLVHQELRSRGCYCEYGEFGELEMLAVSIPDSCDYEEIYEYLAKHEESEALSFAELAA